jgi:hypothetical protein
LTAHRLSKSRFVAGVQCHKLLWWKVHEPNAPELQPNGVLQDLFDQGRIVGELATKEFPAGVLIDLPRTAVPERIAMTKDAISSGAPAVFEACFLAHDTFVAVDILERTDDGFHLIEVKSSTSQKPEHVPDVAVQVHVLSRSGIDVSFASVMHLSADFRNGEVGARFSTSDVTASAKEFEEGVEVELTQQLAMLGGQCPDAPIGARCHDPRPCPFLERYWPSDPNHIRRLYNVGPKKAAQYMARGVHKISELPASQRLPPAAARQVTAVRENRVIVEGGLSDALDEFSGRLGFLDFETIARALPPWPSLGPWHQAAAQFSYHETLPDGSFGHHEWLADGPSDARPALAQALIQATHDADRVVTYSSFESTRIRALQRSVPSLEAELVALEGKLLDLLPVVRNFVYHPDFKGSFSIKSVLRPLVPELGYDDLIIVDGRAASVQIARLLFVAGMIPHAERDRVRADLLAYCERDTWAMVKLLEALRGLSDTH